MHELGSDLNICLLCCIVPGKHMRWRWKTEELREWTSSARKARALAIDPWSAFVETFGQCRCTSFMPLDAHLAHTAAEKIFELRI